MKKSKLILYLPLITIIMIIFIIPQHVKADNNDFSIVKGVLQSYSGTSTEVIIPDSVKRIEYGVFLNHKEITKVTIPSSVTEIGESAFSRCTNLIDIDIPSSVTTIKGSAFLKTAWLDKKRAEDPLVVVNGILVDGHTSTGDITLPDTIKYITDSAFEGNDKITKIIIPDAVITIGASTFSLCYNLKEVVMSDSVETIGDDAFYRCEALTSIKFSNSLEDISSGAFEGCKSLKTITLPDSLKNIGICTFRQCYKLSSVTVPNTLKGINDQAFESCSKKLTFYGIKNSYVSSYADDNHFSYKPLALDKSKASVSIGNKIQLKLNSLADCKWTSSNSSIAAVNSTGKVVAKKKGTVIITASLYGKKYKCSVTVR